jgi:phosphoribosyl-dephospho-CoA transferase
MDDVIMLGPLKVSAYTLSKFGLGVGAINDLKRLALSLDVLAIFNNKLPHSRISDSDRLCLVEN